MASLVILAVFAGPTVLRAAQAGNVAAGIQDPFNAQQYMLELAGKMNATTDSGLLLRGMSAAKPAPARAQPAPKATAARRTSPAPIIVAPKPVLSSPSRQAAKGEAKSPGELFTSFWNSQGLSSPAGPAVADTQAAPAPQTAAARPGPMSHDPAQIVMDKSRRDMLGPLGMAMVSTRPGLTLWTTPSPANLATILNDSDLQREPNFAEADTPWSLGTDLDKYRAYAVREGSRKSGESLIKAIQRAGLTLEDGANIFVLGYGSDRGQVFRANDGKGLLDEPGKVPQQVGATAGSLGEGVYSLADLILFNSLPDADGAAYQDNHPVVRPLIFTGRTIGGAWKTAEEAGNALTWGYFDNVTGCLGLVIEDLLELLKHTGQAATNLVRAPVHMVAGNNEGTDRAMDWVLLVPLEFLSNSVSMKGISNMQDYETAFEDKGVIGSLIEFGGSTFLVYRAVDKALDKLDDDHHSRRCRNDAGGAVEPETPPDTTVPTEIPSDLVVLVEGEWPIEGATSSTGLILIDGVWTTIKMWRQ